MIGGRRARTSTCGRSTPPRSPGNICAATPTFCESAGSSNAPPAAAFSTQPRRTRSSGAGVCDFASATETGSASKILWAPRALPSVIALTSISADLADPKFQLPPLSLSPAFAAEGTDRLVERGGAVLRVHLDAAGAEPPAVLLPLDQLFEIRAAAAIRLWRGLTGRKPGPNPATLSKARRDRLVLGLRALDGRLEGASYREIAGVLFGVADVSKRGWKTHDLRDRTIRLVRFGFDMMEGGYRLLLLYPYRRRS